MFARFGSLLTRVSSHAATDGELLARFVRQRDEAAFAALVDRHGPMVLGMCRRILGDAQAAEDACQAAFLVLARKAAGLSRTEALAGWLYDVARRVALKARSARPTEPLPAREREGRGRDPLAEMTGREILAILEEELNRLPAAHRLPVVLCCLEGLTLEEAAARAGCTVGALRGRLERGRVRLRARLTARGLAPAAVLGVAGVPRLAAASTLPPGLPALTARAALNFGSRTGPVPTGPRQLAEAVLHTMRTTQLKLVAVALVATVLLVPALLAQNAREHTPPAAAAGADTPGTAQEPKDPEPGVALTGRVRSEPGGKPAAGVAVTLWKGGGGDERRTTRTDANGAYTFRDLNSGDHYRVWLEYGADRNREAATWSEWGRVRFEGRRAEAPDLFVEMPQSVAGTVTDAATGKPVRGAVINFSTADGDRYSIKTDAAGRYRLFVAARVVDLYCEGTRDRYEEATRRQRLTVEAGKHLTDIDFKVRSGPPFGGSVVMPDGRPATGAEVRVETRWVSPNVGWGLLGGRDFRLKTDDEGRFHGYMVGALGGAVEGTFGRLNGVRAPTVELKLIVLLADRTAGGVLRAKTTDDDDYRLDPLKVVLAKTSGSKVRVVNPDGKPVTDAGVIARYFDLSGPFKNAGEGKYQMTGLVPGLEYELVVRAPGLVLDQHSPGQVEFGRDVVLKPGEDRDLGEVRMEWWDKRAVPGLIVRLKSTEWATRGSAAGALGDLGSDAVDAVPALIEALNRDPHNTVRFGAAAALGKVGPAAKAAVPDLIKALREDTGGGVQREAAAALGLIGDPGALPFLKEALDNTDIDVRKAAGEAIERLEGSAKTRRPPR